MPPLSIQPTQWTEASGIECHDKSSDSAHSIDGPESFPQPPCRAYIPHKPYCQAEDSGTTCVVVRAQRRKRKERLRHSFACNNVPLQVKSNVDSHHHTQGQTQSHCDQNHNIASDADLANQPSETLSDNDCVVGDKTSSIWEYLEGIAQRFRHASNDPLPLHIFRTIGNNVQNSSLASLDQDGVFGNADRVGQCLFICLEQGPLNRYVLAVPFSRPTEPRSVWWSVMDGETWRDEYYPIWPWERALECNSDVLERMRDEC